MGIMLILVVSILLQFVAAILALRLIRITGRRIGWAMIAAAVTLMALRRCITLFNFLSGGTAPDLQSEWVALATSVLTAAGVGTIGSLFVSMKQSKDALRESERTYATLFSNLPGMVYRCRNDKDWSAEFVSEGIYALTGYLPSDFTEGKIAFGPLIHPDDREAVWNNIQEALKERRPYRLTYRIRPASGEEKWLSEQGQGIFSPSEELLYLEGFVTDVTEQKRAEEALRGSEARFNAFMENSPITAFIKNEEGRLLYINSTFERTFELQNVDWRGKTDSELWPPETAKMLRANDVAILF